jgi:hypothetical protein
MVCDFMTFGCVEFAQQHDIPLVINCAELRYIHTTFTGVDATVPVFGLLERTLHAVEAVDKQVIDLVVCHSCFAVLSVNDSGCLVRAADIRLPQQLTNSR